MGNSNPFDPFDKAEGLEAAYDETMLIDDTDEMDAEKKQQLIDEGLIDEEDLVW